MINHTNFILLCIFVCF